MRWIQVGLDSYKACPGALHDESIMGKKSEKHLMLVEVSISYSEIKIGVLHFVRCPLDRLEKTAQVFLHLPLHKKAKPHVVALYVDIPLWECSVVFTSQSGHKAPCI
jgi:hypothetical protein